MKSQWKDGLKCPTDESKTYIRGSNYCFEKVKKKKCGTCNEDGDCDCYRDNDEIINKKLRRICEKT
jgi:hypothetical protein